MKISGEYVAIKVGLILNCTRTRHYISLSTTNLGKLYFLPKIHKKFFNVPRRPVIFNCGTPTEKASVLLDYHLKPVIQSSWSYTQDSGDFLLRKIKQMKNFPENSIIVTADILGRHPSIPHKLRLKALEQGLQKNRVQPDLH